MLKKLSAFAELTYDNRETR